MAHQNRLDMSQDEQRKFFTFKVDKSNKFEVVRAHENREPGHGEHQAGAVYEVVCKSLPEEGPIFSSPHQEAAIACCNFANELMRGYKHNGPKNPLPAHELEGLEKSHAFHGLAAPEVQPKLTGKVERYYRLLLEMGRL